MDKVALYYSFFLTLEHEQAIDLFDELCKMELTKEEYKALMLLIYK